MDQFSINKAARLMRAGDEFSKTNQKLLKAVSCFVQWLFTMVGNQQLPVEMGWTIEKMSDKPIRLAFEVDIGGWYDVYSDPSKNSTSSAIKFCQALAGLEGQRLIVWLEQEAKTRKLMLGAIQPTMGVIQSIATPK